MSNGNRRRREVLYAKQDGKCFYCERLTGFAGAKNLFPVMEHFVPRHRGGKRSHAVLACAWCDTAKGMIPGPEFVALILDETKDRTFSEAMGDIKRKAKAINIRLHRAYDPVPSRISP